MKDDLHRSLNYSKNKDTRYKYKTFWILSLETVLTSIKTCYVKWHNANPDNTMFRIWYDLSNLSENKYSLSNGQIHINKSTREERWNSTPQRISNTISQKSFFVISGKS